ncbi:hypothetical protein SAMN05660691_02746 [Rheinheimera pacifica]|uniref:DUF4397 domain-containing protein n=1 Tax=Rheinheimera pacifica TaxID=173990 RepID=A0A1H6MQI9_9GAMM|nr:DUF4397 domain-containing protein [Rheinheimera pacifica]SEI00863.1 hypothetical protein SAMN05660691_02746 [Rheinheimera pacifica]
MRIFLLLSLLLGSVTITGCGGSSSDDTSATYTSSYIQLYNGSANSTSTRLTLTNSDDTSVLAGSATYADATSLVTYTPANYDIKLSRLNSDGDEISVLETNITLRKSYKHLLLLTGDYNNPELLKLEFLRDDSLTDTFKLYVASLLPDDAYDVYLSKSDATFDDATLAATLNYSQISSPLEFDSGNYIIYVTNAGSRDILFQSSKYNFEYLTEYVLVPRIASGPLAGNIAVDVINNTTTVGNLTDLTAQAQFRLYNSIDSIGNSDVYLNDSVAFTSLAADSLSAYVELAAKDYRLSASNEQGVFYLNSALMTLNQGQSKAVVLYQNTNSNTAAVVVEESNAPQIYDFDINVVNTITSYSSLGVYFVPPNETIDTAEYYITSLNSGAQKEINVPDGEYTIYLTYTDSNKNKTLLAESEVQQFVAGSNYLLVAEPDSTRNSGYKLSLLR